MTQPTQQATPVCPVCGHQFPGFSLGDQPRDRAILASICPSRHESKKLREAFPEVFPA